MKPLLSTRELARAIGASESSLKRWADEGLIHGARTAGGHRRSQSGEAGRVIRETHAPLVHPEVLGLGSVAAVNEDAPPAEEAAERLFAHLRDGRGREARDLILSQYLAGQSTAAIADGPIRAAFERIGELWRHDEAGIVLEHRATQICMAAVQQLGALVENPEKAFVAVGGAPSGDPYILPTLLAATVLASEGLEAINLGADTPFSALMEAARRYHAGLVWLSVSVARDPKELEQNIEALADSLHGPGTKLALGGSALPRARTSYGEDVFVGESLSELAAFAKGLRIATKPGS